MACLLGGKDTKSQVWFFSKASYSCCIAMSQSLFARACFTVLGSEWVRKSEGWSLGLWIPYLDLVCIGWVLTGIELGIDRDSEADEVGLVD